MVRKVNFDAAGKPQVEAQESAPVTLEAAEPTELRVEAVEAPVCSRCGSPGVICYGRTEKQTFWHCLRPPCNVVFATGEGSGQKLMATPDMRACEFTYQDKRLGNMPIHYTSGFLGPGEGIYFIPSARERVTDVAGQAIAIALTQGKAVSVHLLPVIKLMTVADVRLAVTAKIKELTDSAAAFEKKLKATWAAFWVEGADISWSALLNDCAAARGIAIKQRTEARRLQALLEQKPELSGRDLAIGAGLGIELKNIEA